MSEELVCWKCGASIADLPLPLSRYAVCPQCDAELHVCRLCRYYDTSVANACREPIAEPVKEKMRANFCGYFQPRPGAWQPDDAAGAQGARAQLEALFGAAQDAPQPGPASEADAARERLEQLFGDPDKDR